MGNLSSIVRWRLCVSLRCKIRTSSKPGGQLAADGLAVALPVGKESPISTELLAPRSLTLVSASATTLGTVDIVARAMAMAPRMVLVIEGRVGRAGCAMCDCCPPFPATLQVYKTPAPKAL